MPKLFPYMHVQDFLGEALSGELLSHAIERKDDYVPSRVGSTANGKDRVDENIRVSCVLRDLGRFEPVLQGILRDFLPDMLTGLRISPFASRERVEIEIAAHGNGAFYKRHIDMRLGETADRVVSAVYYMHRRPKAFSGGQLRIHPVSGMPGGDEAVDIEPVHDSLLVFPSYVPHEVLPIVCPPDTAFEDHRFALNCWVYKA